MIRNREIQLYLLASIILTVCSTIAAYFLFSIAAAYYVFVVALLLIIVYFFFTKWRYNEINKLSNYLRKIANGDYTLDVRDNYEGELSILKSEIFKVTVKLSEQRTKLEEDKLKLKDALSDISHQLKTPLTSMMVMADLLSDPDLDEQKRAEFTNNIHQQLERMEWLVSSLLKFAKIDAGTLQMKQEKQFVLPIINKAVETVLIPMDIKQQTLTIKGDENVTFHGDFHWTLEAIINLLKNCVEHTEEGGKIEIRFSQNPLYTEIIIQDNGKGIPKEDMPYIFKRFYKGKNASDDSVGIGLALAHSIITNQQGTIEAESKMGAGTKFIIKFYQQINI